ncbi:MBL fold metallo-hydrolase [Comamonas thiooxydans]|uniref:MBL fold metallo-hydrolase n=1 Tax=Comamonas thiooxydans TaxID=363952 RepID=UPI00244ACC62|nr:MBL fold metallo-hydrolase [Comamonas thiooxydans]MDH1255842.1 MBL fold metallo-hydrolase [Comamonas thiooxydans]
MTSSTHPNIQPFFDTGSSTFSYVLFDRQGGRCAVIDSVLNFDSKSGRTSTEGADEVIRFVQANSLSVDWLLETHVHADHISAAPYLQAQLGGLIGIGAGIRTVHEAFSLAFMLPEDSMQTLQPFGRLFEPDERLKVGELSVRAMHVPGHTPADLAYVVESIDGAPGVAFVGDTLFMPDVGSARCDFPGGCAKKLFASVRRLLQLPPETRLMMCHDYPPPGREPICETTVLEQWLHNVHIREDVTEDEFVRMRRTRDASLAMPTLMLQSIQVNIRAGVLPAPEKNGICYLRIPLNVF